MQDSVIRLWDLPLRLFHWLLAVSVTGALITGWLGGNLMPWHGRLGLLVLGLLAFRLLWGFWGSTYARWGCIIRAPFSLARYLRGQWHRAGHNPMGSVSVLALLGLLAFQVSSGLVANDDIAFQGPLYRLLEAETSSTLTGLHRQAQWLLVGLISLHVLAIVFYRLKGKALVPAMITGKAQREHPEQQSAQGGAWWSALIAVVLAAALVWTVQAAETWLAPTAPANTPAASTPDW